jgi:hypothetical protein
MDLELMVPRVKAMPTKRLLLPLLLRRPRAAVRRVPAPPGLVPSRQRALLPRRADC